MTYRTRLFLNGEYTMIQPGDGTGGGIMKQVPGGSRVLARRCGSSPNTVHLTILIRLAKSIRRVRWRLRGADG